MSNANVMPEPRPDVRVLRDDKLDAVNGGLVVNAIIGVLLFLLSPAVQPAASGKR